MKKIRSLLLSIVLVLVLSFAAAGCDNEKGAAIFTVNVIGGSGGGRYYENINCTVTADVPSGKQFIKWVADGEDLSSDAVFTFTVTKDIEISAVLADSVPGASKDAFAVKVSNNPGGGNYLSGSECTLKLAAVYTGRNFKGWVKVDSEGVEGDVVSTENPYKFIVTESVNLAAAFNDIVLSTPDNAEDQMIKFNGAEITYDRNETTAFADGVDYIKFYVYVDNNDDAQPILAFKMFQDTNGKFYFSALDNAVVGGAAKWELLGSAGDLHTPDGNTHNWLKLLIGTGSAGEYSTETTYYYATQAIAIEGGLYVDSSISAKGSGWKAI